MALTATTTTSSDDKKSEKVAVAAHVAPHHVGRKKHEKSETEKRLKREKKKRRAVRKAIKKQELLTGGSASTTTTTTTDEAENIQREINTTWRRVGKSEGCPKAHNRPVDEEKINTLLEQRSQAKTNKEYEKSDAIAETMHTLGVYYFDARKEWHTRLLSTQAKEKRMEAHAKYNDDEE
mmetsp:Transcript_11464/g.13064  ORF Transcript_11464/g.13064 Transcript_11464/m.13064 type:complete len:179 (+) Transcript_11464:84-620(+)